MRRVAFSEIPWVGRGAQQHTKDAEKVCGTGSSCKAIQEPEGGQDSNCHPMCQVLSDASSLDCLFPAAKTGSLKK